MYDRSMKRLARLLVPGLSATLVCLAWFAPSSRAEPAAQAPASPERWKGEIALPGQALECSMTLQRGPRDGEGASGTLSIPMQGLTDGPLRDVIFSGTKATFTFGMEAMPRERWIAFEVEFAPDGQTGTGLLKQMGMEIPMKLTRLKEGERVGPTRPQEPKPPFPYTSRDVMYTNEIDGATLAGTLTIPEGAGQRPAVLLITGSGGQDRDETLLGHKPFLVIADHLSRAGIAVLRVDDRGVGGSTSPKQGGETTDDFVGDALAGVAFLAKQPEVDPKRIGLIGHSEGGVIAPMVVAKGAGVAFIALLAGTGVPGREVLMEQVPAGMTAAGAAPELVAAAKEAVTKAVDAYIAGDDAGARAGMEALIKAQIGLPADQALPAEANQALDMAVKEFGLPWMQRFYTLDPREALRKVKVPTLVLNGSLDMQVLPDQNIPEIEKALKEAGNTDVTIKVMPGLNHLFQTATTGSGEEYATIEETFAPSALEEMTKWVRVRAGLEK